MAVCSIVDSRASIIKASTYGIKSACVDITVLLERLCIPNECVNCGNSITVMPCASLEINEVLTNCKPVNFIAL